jgi:hypothetical protein
MRKSALPIIVELAVVVAPTLAMAQPTQEFRCAADPLPADAAVQRLEWARRCALTTNTGGPNSSVPSTRAFDMTFNWARDYVEIDTNHAYSGNLNGYNVNYTYAYSRYAATPLYSVTLEASGPTAGFWKWSTSSPRPRPLYPVFETTPSAGTGIQLFPLPTLNDCKLYQRNTATGVFSRWTGNFYVIAYCEAN